MEVGMKNTTKELSNIAGLVLAALMTIILGVLGPLFQYFFTDGRPPTNREVDFIIGYGSFAAPIIAVIVLGATLFTLRLCFPSDVYMPRTIKKAFVLLLGLVFSVLLAMFCIQNL
jgi:hypothetical protein